MISKFSNHFYDAVFDDFDVSKTLKKKLKSPQKSIGGLSNKNGNKTQRFQYDSQDILC